MVGAEAFSCTEISGLSRRSQSTGRLSVDVAVDPPVDQTSVRSEQCPVDPRRSRPSAFGRATNSDEASAALFRQLHLAEERLIPGITLKILGERVALDDVQILVPQLVGSVQPHEAAYGSVR